jgi:hypothetical protein
MSQSANVRSLEALIEFRTALLKYIDKAKRAISTADSEANRTTMWLGSIQQMYWASEKRKAEERLAQAKSELFRATISQPDNPRGPVDEVRLVKKREDEVKHTIHKIKKTKYWSREFEHALSEYKGAMAPLSSSLDGNLHKAVVILSNSIDSLEKYISTSAPGLDESPTTETKLESIARSGDDIKEDTDNEHADSDSPTDKGDKDIDATLGSSE